MDDKVNEAITLYVEHGGKPEDWDPSMWSTNYNIAPMQGAVIVRDDFAQDTGEQKRAAEVATWNFRPAWYTQKRPNINARIETVASNGLFRHAFAHRRCIVPMNGYYEWQTIAGKKQPFFIHAPNDFLSAAGIYTGIETSPGTWEHSFVIITREARDASGEIHDRMPAFLVPELWDDWLQPGELSSKDDMLDRLMGSSDQVAGTITTYPVAPRINNVRADEDWADPTLLDPIKI